MLNFVFALILQPELHQTADILVQRGILAQKARFRPVTVLAEDTDSYLVQANPTDEEDTRILREGDEIILASEELYDGKVVR